jgi:hypothetical protein
MSTDLDSNNHRSSTGLRQLDWQLDSSTGSVDSSTSDKRQELTDVGSSEQHALSMAILTILTRFLAPAFIVVSPITSYTDQIMAIRRAKSSRGFSLDIPLIMLVASIMK